MAEEKPKINEWDVFPCVCGHDETIHYPPEADNDCGFGCCGNQGFGDPGGCDKCDCTHFREMDNLEYLEWQKRFK